MTFVVQIGQPLGPSSEKRSTSTLLGVDLYTSRILSIKSFFFIIRNSFYNAMEIQAVKFITLLAVQSVKSFIARGHVTFLQCENHMTGK